MHSGSWNAHLSFWVWVASQLALESRRGFGCWIGHFGFYIGHFGFLIRPRWLLKRVFFNVEAVDDPYSFHSFHSRHSLGFLASRFLGFSACPVVSRLLGFSASGRISGPLFARALWKKKYISHLFSKLFLVLGGVYYLAHGFQNLVHSFWYVTNSFQYWTKRFQYLATSV